MDKMDKKICFVFGAGEYYGASPPEPGAGDLVIAADGGYAYLAAHNTPVNLVIGDFDSLASADIFENIEIEIIRLSTMKDDTDMAAALREGWERGCRVFHIYGGTGGRLDHTLANIQCLADLAKRGGRGFLFDKETVITVIHNDTLLFPAGAQGTVSLFAHSDIALGVTIKGFKYSLNNATLQNTYPLGVSNEFTGEPGSIAVREGTLIAVYPKNL